MVLWGWGEDKNRIFFIFFFKKKYTRARGHDLEKRTHPTRQLRCFIRPCLCISITTAGEKCVLEGSSKTPRLRTDHPTSALVQNCLQSWWNSQKKKLSESMAQIIPFIVQTFRFTRTQPIPEAKGVPTTTTTGEVNRSNGIEYQLGGQKKKRIGSHGVSSRKDRLLISLLDVRLWILIQSTGWAKSANYL